MISHHHKCIFIHVPKNAGQSVEKVFLDLLDLTWETRAPLLLRPNNNPDLGPPRLAHLKADEYVRFKYLTQEMFDEYFKFGFVRNPWSRTFSIYRYFKLMQLTKEPNFKSFIFGDLTKKFLVNKYWFVGSQKNFFYSKKNRFIVDYVGRFENLQADFNYICSKIDLPKIELPHVNSSEKQKASKESYKDYYDQESIDYIANIYKEDIELFKYHY